VLFSTILFCRFLLHPKMSLEDALLSTDCTTAEEPERHRDCAGKALAPVYSPECKNHR